MRHFSRALLASTALCLLACSGVRTAVLPQDGVGPEDCQTDVWPNLDLDHICPTISAATRTDPITGRRLPPEDNRTLPVDIAVTESGSFLPNNHRSHWPARLRVVVWNTEYTANLDAQVDTLTQHPVLREADVYLLSEVDRCTTRNGMRRAARILAERIGGAYAYGVEFVELSIDRTIGGDTGQAIVSRRPLTRARLTCHSESADWFASPQEPRLGARVTLHADVPVGPATARVFAVHLESNDDGTRRAEQGRELLEAAHLTAHGQPQVIAGDFNAPTRHEAALRILRGAGYVDAMEALHDTGPTHDSGRRIDFAWTRGLRIQGGGVLRGIRTADHSPIWVDLELEASGPTSEESSAL